MVWQTPASAYGPSYCTFRCVRRPPLYNSLASPSSFKRAHHGSVSGSRSPHRVAGAVSVANSLASVSHRDLADTARDCGGGGHRYAVGLVAVGADVPAV